MCGMEENRKIPCGDAGEQAVPAEKRARLGAGRRRFSPPPRRRFFCCSPRSVPPSMPSASNPLTNDGKGFESLDVFMSIMYNVLRQLP